MKYLYKSFWLIITSLILTSCGSGSGTDPHLTAQELLELQELAEVSLVGKWKLRRPTRSISTKTFIATNSCDVYQIEFLDNDTYLLNISYTSTGSSELSYQLYRGKYDIAFTDSDTEVTIDRVVLLGNDYLPSTNVPDQGTVATLTEIEIDDIADNISFSIKLEADTAALCLTDAVVSLSGDKEEKIEINAPEDSNHKKILNEWRMVEVVTSIGESSSSSDPCQFFLEEFIDRCVDEETNEVQANCFQPTTLTLLFSDYGTYLLIYYDVYGNILSSEEGEWRWLPNADSEYTFFQVRFEEDSWEDATVLEVSELTETTLRVVEPFDFEGNQGDGTIRYNFQLASLPFTNSSCTDF